MLVLLLIICLKHATSTNTMVMFRGTLEAINNLSSSDIDYDSCVTLCLDNTDCVAFTYNNICTIYSIDQFDNFTKNEILDERIGIKYSMISNYLVILVQMNYQFDEISDDFYNVNVTSCYGWKVFRRTRGYYCINLFESTNLVLFDLNYCSKYSCFLAGFDNQNEINYIAEEIRKRSPGRKFFGIDGQRKSDCYDGLTVICNDFEWTNNYTQSPPLINWSTNEPSVRNSDNITETHLSVYCEWSSVNIMNDIAPNTVLNGHICGMPVGDWNFDN
ncbi:unnamed protein product [Caenorhabditis angaria]|uniref:Apple domain-containing protein n=1 Tax=Caenorhabditis angaria TaxID=860376 RepID=A0A9P1MXP8_9PELO|nr:unnamed protein product [Caenorhabditis angaria]